MPAQRTGGRALTVMHHAIVAYGLFKTACGRDTRLQTLAETTKPGKVTCRRCLAELLRRKAAA